MSPLRMIYLALAVWGAIHPMYWFVTYMRETGTGLSGLIDAWYVNASTTGLMRHFLARSGPSSRT